MKAYTPTNKLTTTAAMVAMMLLLAAIATAPTAGAQTQDPFGGEDPVMYGNPAEMVVLGYFWQEMPDVTTAGIIMMMVDVSMVEDAMEMRVISEDAMIQRELLRVGADEGKIFGITDGSMGGMVIVLREQTNVYMVVVLAERPGDLDESVLYDFVGDVVDDGKADAPPGYVDMSDV